MVMMIEDHEQTTKAIRELSRKLIESERVEMIMYKKDREYDRKESRDLYMRNRKQLRV